MRQLDYYEFVGILLPGSTVLIGLFLQIPDLLGAEWVKDFSVGGLGVFVILAYVLGHIVQAVGNIVEWAWWKAWNGMPSDWLRTNPDRLLASSQVTAVESKAQRRLGIEGFQLSALSVSQWYPITRQIYADVAGAGCASRIDIFNGNYGLNRGIAAGLLVVALLLIFQYPIRWKVIAGASAGAALALYRMHRFARHYARELFVQFIQLPSKEPATESGK